MKILVIGSRIPFPPHDGGAIATYNLLKGLSESGLEVTFASLNTKKHFVDAKTISAKFSFLNNIHTYYINANVNPVNALINIFSSNSYNIDRFYVKRFEKILLNLIANNTFDVIHFEGLFVSSYAPAVKKATKAPLLLRQHNIEFNIWKTLAIQTRFRPKRKYLEMLTRRLEQFEKNIVHLFDSVVAIAEKDEEEIRQQGYNGLLKTIAAGFEVPEVNFDDPVDFYSIYHIGSMEWMPNRQAMEWFKTDIWPVIQKKKSKAQFYMAGKNMPKKFMKLNDSNFHVLGEVESLSDFVKNKSVLIVPLKSGSGIRIKIIEAMLAGKAVVCTSLAAEGLPLDHIDNCLIAETGEDLAKAVIRLLDKDSIRDWLAENGRNIAIEYFSNESVSRKWKEFYGELMDNH